MSSAYFDDATLARGVTGAKTTKTTKANAKPQETPQEMPPAPKIADEKIAAEVDAIRAFERERIEPILADFPLFLRPKSTAGLTQIGACGLYCRTSQVREYRAKMREIVNLRWAFRRTRLGGMFAVALIYNALDESAALEACALNFHDDRGDGLLYVPAFKAKATREAWERAAAALGIATKCRPCAR